MDHTPLNFAVELQVAVGRRLMSVCRASVWRAVFGREPPWRRTWWKLGVCYVWATTCVQSRAMSGPTRTSAFARWVRAGLPSDAVLSQVVRCVPIQSSCRSHRFVPSDSSGNTSMANTWCTILPVPMYGHSCSFAAPHPMRTFRAQSSMHIHVDAPLSRLHS